MKADILRRAEEISDSEDSEDDLADRGRTLAFEDELDDVPVVADKVVVLGDGEESDDDGEDNEGEGAGNGEGKEQPEGLSSPETVLELAYIRNPKLFDRDAQTRRGKPRADLRSLTGMFFVLPLETMQA
jgi:activating signal cointegrator complex subunit 2